MKCNPLCKDSKSFCFGEEKFKSFLLILTQETLFEYVQNNYYLCMFKLIHSS